MRARLMGKAAFVMLAGFVLAGCDDDDKKTRYKIEIEMTDNIDWEIRTIKGKSKPEVTVSYPKGVEVRGRETKPAKTVSFDGLPQGASGLALLLMIVSTGLLWAGLSAARRHTDLSPSPA